MADLIQRLQQDTKLSSGARRDRISAIQRLCRFAGYTPATVPASISDAKRLLDRLSAPYCDITPRTFANMRSLVRDALNRYRPGQRDDHPARFILPPQWAELAAAAPDKRRLIVLRRFMRYCAINGWVPGDVNLDKLILFGAMLKDNVIIDAEHHIRLVAAAWNRAGRGVPGWPAERLILGASGRRFSFDWDTFPQSLRDDLAAYLGHRTKAKLTNLHLTDPVGLQPLKPRSAMAIQYQVRALASALVHDGVPIEEISSLSVLIRPDMAERSMKFFIKRHGGSFTSAQTTQLAWTMLMIGRLWVKPCAENIEFLENIRDQCTLIQVSMTDKNRERLIVVDDPRIRRLLYNLPATLEKLAEEIKSKRRAASHMQLAVAMEILLHCPIRIGNLASIDLDRHFMKGTAGPNGQTHLVFPKHEVKNDIDLDFVLDQSLVNLISRFKVKYRPELSGGKSSTFLFPAKNHRPLEAVCANDLPMFLRTYLQIYRPILLDLRSPSSSAPEPMLWLNLKGKPLSYDGFYWIVKSRTRAKFGFVVGPHHFRRCSASSVASEDPEHVGVASSILGHHSPSMTEGTYNQATSLTASRRHNQLIRMARRELNQARGSKLRTSTT